MSDQILATTFYLSHFRNDALLGDSSFGVYTFWGDKPRFKESIDFKFLSPLFPENR
jgi:hypothetical protein